MRPVGVGARSRGPKGNAGFTTTTGTPDSANRRATRSERYFDRMYGLALSYRLNWTVSSEGAPSSRRPTAAIEDVYTTRGTRAALAASREDVVPSMLTR